MNTNIVVSGSVVMDAMAFVRVLYGIIVSLTYDGIVLVVLEYGALVELLYKILVKFSYLVLEALKYFANVIFHNSKRMVARFVLASVGSYPVVEEVEDVPGGESFASMDRVIGKNTNVEEAGAPTTLVSVIVAPLEVVLLMLMVSVIVILLTDDMMVPDVVDMAADGACRLVSLDLILSSLEHTNSYPLSTAYFRVRG